MKEHRHNATDITSIYEYATISPAKCRNKLQDGGANRKTLTLPPQRRLACDAKSTAWKIDQTKNTHGRVIMRTEYAFGDVRRSLAKEIGKAGFEINFQSPRKPDRNSLISTVMRLAA